MQSDAVPGCGTAENDLNFVSLFPTRVGTLPAGWNYFETYIITGTSPQNAALQIDQIYSEGVR
jgi:hypothetical protein